ncbi:MAG: alkaline phosphatase family protein [Candidatus Nanohaloarchaea archaeon]|nr:alkaline phosphatase family protein [Candidatus Nanohaloarchaea archaeon]
MTDAVLLMDGADFERFTKNPKYDAVGGGIPVETTSSLVNWAQLLTGSSIVDAGVLPGQMTLTGSGPEPASFEKKKLLNGPPREMLNAEPVFEQLEREGNRVGCFYVPFSYPDAEVTVTSHFETRPAMDVMQRPQSGETPLDIDANTATDEFYTLSSLKTEDALTRTADENLDVVFTFYHFPDFFGHKHMKGTADDLMEETVTRYTDSGFENIVLVSDHRVDPRRDTRQAPGVHALPARYCIIGGDQRYGEVQPDEFAGVIRSELTDDD